jgi:hypothetical protein
MQGRQGGGVQGRRADWATTRNGVGNSIFFACSDSNRRHGLSHIFYFIQMQNATKEMRTLLVSDEASGASPLKLSYVVILTVNSL